MFVLIILTFNQFGTLLGQREQRKFVLLDIPTCLNPIVLLIGMHALLQVANLNTVRQKKLPSGIDRCSNRITSLKYPSAYFTSEYQFQVNQNIDINFFSSNSISWLRSLIWDKICLHILRFPKQKSSYQNSLFKVFKVFKDKTKIERKKKL